MDVSREGSWTPGEHIAFAWPDGFALIASHVGMVLAEQLMLLLRERSELGGFVRALAQGSGTGLLELPSFAVAIRDGERWHLAVRNEFTMTFLRSQAVERITGAGVATWEERVLPGIRALRIGWPSQDAKPYEGGLVSASGIGFGHFQYSDLPAQPQRLLVEQTPEPEPETDYLGGDTVDDEVSPAPQYNSFVRVPAKFCGNRHPNPPDRTRCFICNDSVSGPVQQTRRPQLGWLRAPHNEPLPLHGPVIVGRHPKAGALSLGESPELLTLSYRHVSGNHLAILLDGWRVLAQDLQSTNGTCLRRRAKLPVRLPRHPITLLPGDVIDLGHDLLLHLDRIP